MMETVPIALPIGKLSPLVVRVGDANRGNSADLEGQPSLPNGDGDDGEDGVDGGSGSGGNGGSTTTRRKITAPSEMEPCEFCNPGTVVAGIAFTTTAEALGIESLTLRATKQSQIIATSDKSTTFRVTLDQQDLVWRQLDIYGVPRHVSELILRQLQLMAIREITAYAHLRLQWGVLLPRLYYFGQDFNMFWTLVTSYEGRSLDIVSREENGLKFAVKQRARASLKQLHDSGVIHGDVALRNALLRDSDGAILWVDFEFASVRSRKDGDDDDDGNEEEDEEFARSAQWEQTVLDRELDHEPTLPETRPPTPPLSASPSSPRHGNDPKASVHRTNKRTKVFAHCCCTSPSDSE
jgi:serine/threonine protein kinase